MRFLAVNFKSVSSFVSVILQILSFLFVMKKFFVIYDYAT